MRAIVLLLIRGYQQVISPWLPASCRFQPSCSQYAIEAVTRYGVVKGGWLTLRRILRCRPGGGITGLQRPVGLQLQWHLRLQGGAPGEAQAALGCRHVEPL